MLRIVVLGVVGLCAYIWLLAIISVLMLFARDGPSRRGGVRDAG